VNVLVLDMPAACVCSSQSWPLNTQVSTRAPSQEIDGATGSFGRNEMLLQDRQIGCHDDTALKPRTRPVDAERSSGRLCRGGGRLLIAEAIPALRFIAATATAAVGQLLSLVTSARQRRKQWRE